ncbi:hypothetical protein [Phragmitibacter flavus]|uniref:hypothetical protein n=1 Tax=Phragmitibacter flavus TaxID=2576071 RepID=UPI00140C2101|nr:hypothetical protein [Phragmitibacter flavus]
MRPQALFPLTVLLLLAILTTSCGLLRKKRAQQTDESTGDLAIGAIEMVNPEQKFVLISAHRGYAIVAGTALYTFSPSGLKAELKVTPERKHTFLSADIIEGYPQKGNPVFATREAVSASMAAAKANGTGTGSEPPPLDNQLNWGGVPGAPTPNPVNTESNLPPLQNPFINPASEVPPTVP